MYIVPLPKDTIKTHDGGTYKVVTATMYKEAGPALYARTKEASNILIYFIDIDEVNGTRVEYQKGEKLFKALGKVERVQPLPQPGDTAVVRPDINASRGRVTVKVEGLKLKSKALGINKGLFIKGDDGEFYRIKQILDIEPALGTHKFDRELFLSQYEDYKGV